MSAPKAKWPFPSWRGVVCEETLREGLKEEIIGWRFIFARVWVGREAMRRMKRGFIFCIMRFGFTC